MIRASSTVVNQVKNDEEAGFHATIKLAFRTTDSRPCSLVDLVALISRPPPVLSMLVSSRPVTSTLQPLFHRFLNS